MALSPTSHLPCSLALLLLSTVGCNTADALPGTALGTFAMTGVLSGNTCGDKLNPANPWQFDAEMSLSGNTLYFRHENAEDLSAPLDSDNLATCTSVVNSQPSNDSACTLSLKSIYTIQLDSTTAPKTASGSLRFEYSAVSSTTCDLTLAENGGVYDELPCSVEYLYTALKK